MDVGEPALGGRLHSFGVVLHGALSERRWCNFLSKVVEAIGMTPAALPIVFNFPIAGKGGVGMTIFQPITESFLVLDTWSDHDGAYLLVCSCKPFESKAIDLVAKEFRLRPGSGENAAFRSRLDLR